MFIHAPHSISSEAVGGSRSEVKLNPGVFLKIPLPVGDLLETKANPLNLLPKLIICSARLCSRLRGRRHRTSRAAGNRPDPGAASPAGGSPPRSDSQTRSRDPRRGRGGRWGVGSKWPCLWAPPCTPTPELPDRARNADPELAPQDGQVHGHRPAKRGGRLGPGCLPRWVAGMPRKSGRGTSRVTHLRGSRKRVHPPGPRCPHGGSARRGNQENGVSSSTVSASQKALRFGRFLWSCPTRRMTGRKALGRRGAKAGPGRRGRDRRGREMMSF